MLWFLQWAKNACQTGRENVIGGLDGGTVRRCGQECSLASVQMQVAGGERSVLPKLTLFLFSSFVLTGVDETKATANGISGGVERVATYTKRRVE